MDARRLETLVDRLDELVAEFRASLRDTTEVVFVPRNGAWEKSMIEWLRPRIAHFAGVVALFDLAAERAGQVVHYKDVVARAALSEQQVRNELAALSRLVREEYGEKRWPLEAWQSSSTGRMEYRMPLRIAEWWRGS
jgi:hypothetical protein